MNQPYFSIVIPIYNREKLVKRAIDSCLQNPDFKDFEIIAVDDCSKDNSYQVVSAYPDSRIRVLRHRVNRGVCPARNTGINEARGKWILFLDSDDAFLPESLEIIYQHTLGISEKIGQVAFNSYWGKDNVAPDPPLISEIWNYKRYIEWADNINERADILSCIRKTAFKDIQFPENHALESKFHLDLAKRFNTKTVPVIVRQIFQDAENQITQSDNSARRKYAPDRAESLSDLIWEHGKALLKYGPKKYWNFVGAAATNHYLAGNKWRGYRYAIHYLTKHPFNMRMWIILKAGLFGSGILESVLNMRARCQCKCNR